MFALIDNYDSFTWNLYHLMGGLGAETRVWRNDTITVDGLLALEPEGIVLSPGPCAPDQAGICLETIRRAAGRVPVFGVCLGHQAIGQAFGGAVVRAPSPMHGKVDAIRHQNDSVFAGLPSPFQATRYHSLCVTRDGFPADLVITADSADGVIMGMRHRVAPIHGVQFHPESIATEHGARMMQTFLDIARAWNAQGQRPARAVA